MFDHPFAGVVAGFDAALVSSRGEYHTWLMNNSPSEQKGDFAAFLAHGDRHAARRLACWVSALGRDAAEPGNPGRLAALAIVLAVRDRRGKEAVRELLSASYKVQYEVVDMIAEQHGLSSAVLFAYAFRGERADDESVVLYRGGHSSVECVMGSRSGAGSGAMRQGVFWSPCIGYAAVYAAERAFQAPEPVAPVIVSASVSVQLAYPLSWTETVAFDATPAPVEMRAADIIDAARSFHKQHFAERFARHDPTWQPIWERSDFKAQVLLT